MKLKLNKILYLILSIAIILLLNSFSVPRQLFKVNHSNASFINVRNTNKHLVYNEPSSETMNLLNNNKTAVTTLYSVSEIRQNKTILYWDTFHGAKDMGIGLGYQIFANCSIRSCIVTDNRTFLPVDSFDAIIFHGARYSLKKNYKPKNRTIDQKYIFYSLESYYNTDFDSWTNFNFYNWTMTFRRDSDIHSPYGVITKKLTDYTIPSVETINNKMKKVAWFVSNCRTTGSKRRLRYGKELQKHIPVDIYGTCGNLKCTDSVQCYQMLNANYKFYLAFENSFCEDYVTEKLFNILRYNVVPVVLSFADYNTIAPPYSVINTNSFMNPKHLAEYLWYLDRNYTEYVKYFEWKKEYIVENSTQYVLCQLCDKLHKPLTYSWYKDVKHWYYGYSCLQ